MNPLKTLLKHAVQACTAWAWKDEIADVEQELQLHRQMENDFHRALHEALEKNIILTKQLDVAFKAAMKR